MKRRYHSVDQPPRREELSAYFDGELTANRRRQLEAWLADHPDVQAELEDWRQLRQEWRSTQPADPGAKVWNEMLAHISAARPVHRLRLRRAVATVAALAAGLLLAVVLQRPAAVGPETTDTEPLVLAAHGDVEIISIEAADIQALVVGRPPLHEPLVLADSADINVEHIEPDHDGAVPSVRWWSGVDAPMIVATLSNPER